MAFEVANLHAKQISMLHTTAGGVGLIALEYARLVGSIPHATAGGKTKHATIRLLNQEVVHSSRNGTAFACGALHHISSNRMHLILNSLSGDLTAVSFALLGEGSAFEWKGGVRPHHASPLHVRPIFIWASWPLTTS